MSDTLVYQREDCANSQDVRVLRLAMCLPQASRFLPCDPETYFRYVTETPNVFYVKIYENCHLVGGVHLETEGDTVHLALLVLPEYRRRGIGTAVLRDLALGRLPVFRARIEAAIAEENKASLALFEKAGFRFVSRDGNLLNYEFNVTASQREEP